jgi:hypothetical protein
MLLLWRGVESFVFHKNLTQVSSAIRVSLDEQHYE